MREARVRESSTYIVYLGVLLNETRRKIAYDDAIIQKYADYREIEVSMKNR